MVMGTRGNGNNIAEMGGGVIIKLGRKWDGDGNKVMENGRERSKKSHYHATLSWGKALRWKKICLPGWPQWQRGRGQINHRHYVYNCSLNLYISLHCLS